MSDNRVEMAPGIDISIKTVIVIEIVIEVVINA